MNTQWVYRKIGDVCIVERGGSPRPIDKYITDADDGINWIKIGDTTDSMYITETAQKIKPEGMKKSRYVQPGDFLLSNSMSFGRPYILKIDGCIHDGWLVLRDKDELFDKRFLYYYLSSKTTYQNFKSMAVGGVVNNLNSEMVRRVDVPVPSKREQNEIANLLDKLNAVILMRQQELQKLDDLVKARFVEMFGDPGTNPMEWPKLSLVDLCADPDDIKCGPFGTQLKKEEYLSEGIPVWGIPEVNSHFAKTPDYYVSKEKAQELAPYTVCQGDLVMSRKGNVGTCALYPSDFSPGIIHSDVLRIRTDVNRVDSHFMMHQLHISQDVQWQIAQVSNGAVMAGINVTKLKQIKVLLPDYKLQKEFAAFVIQADKSKFAVQRSLDEVRLLFDSLMQKYFG